MKFLLEVQCFPVLAVILATSLAQLDYCREGTYGHDCELKCSNSCRPLSTYPCDKGTGKCTEGCEKGYYGSTCNIPCDCPFSGICIQETGGCIEDTTKTTTSEVPEIISRTTSSECESCIPWMVIALIFITFIIAVALVVLARNLYLCCNKKSAETSVQANENADHKIEKQEKTAEKQNETRIMSILEKEKRDAEEEAKKLKKELEECRSKVTKLMNLSVCPAFPPSSAFHIRNTTQMEKSQFFQCPRLAYDTSLVKVDMVHIDDNSVLWNKPDLRETGNSKSRFQHYYGTSSTFPITTSRFDQYFEAICHFRLDKQLGDKEILMDIGFCGKSDRDKEQFTPKIKNSCSLKAAGCAKHKMICFFVEKNGKEIAHAESGASSSQNTESNVKVGVLLNKKGNKIRYFDLRTKALLECVAVETFNHIWPLFGLGAQNTARSSLQLISGIDIDMSEEKVAMIEKTKKPKP